MLDLLVTSFWTVVGFAVTSYACMCIFPGYPPADHVVRDFLTKGGTQAESYHRACCFIDALFQHTAQILRSQFEPESGLNELALEFRRLMTAGQKMKEHNEFRRQFYDRVVLIAQEKLVAQRVCFIYLGYNRRLKVSQKVHQSDSEPGYNYKSLPKSTDSVDYSFSPAASCDELVQCLKKIKSKVGEVSKKKQDDSYPLIILAFDEAHTLIDREEAPSATWSNFSNLRHVLRALYRLPLFSLFLSTTGKISLFTSPGEDSSQRIVFGNLILIQPFSDLGFDTLAKKVSLDGSWDLETVTADAHIVYLGRPL